jgi:hypothetical protein
VTKKYLIGDDKGFVRKVVLIDKTCQDPKIKTFGSNLIKIAEASGDSDMFRGFEATAPTLYIYVDNFETIKEVGSFVSEGSLYEAQWSGHSSVLVYCHVKTLDDFNANTSAFTKASSLFGMEKK